MKIESRIGKSVYTDETIYNFISDFTNFRQLIPGDRVKDFEATSDSCTFDVQPLGRTGLKIVEKEACKLVKVATDRDYSKYQLTLWFQIKAIGPEDTRLKLTAEPDINPLLATMIKGQVKVFLDQMVDKLEEFNFNQGTRGR